MIRRGQILVALLALLTGCGSVASALDSSIGERFHLDKSFERLLAEFDSVAALADPLNEPEQLEYVSSPERLPWYVRQMEGLGFDFLLTRVIGVKPAPVLQDNPSGYARERLTILVSMVGGDAVRGARVAARLLWVLEKDRNLLNRVLALRGIETIVAGLGLNPMDPVLDTADDSEARREQVAMAAAQMKEHWPANRKGRLSNAQRQVFEAAVAALIGSPLPSSLKRRQLLLALATGCAMETDARMRASLQEALRRSLLFAAGLGLRNSLTVAAPELRDVAIRAYSRLCGPVGVPYVLRRIATPAGWGPGNPYDSDPLVRLTLIRLCAQLQGEAAVTSVQGGKMPVDFLYDTVVGDDDPGLRQVALEGLSLCLQRPRIDFDEEWVTQWRRRFIIERSKK